MTKPQKTYPPGEYQCPGCYTAYATEAELVAHRRTVHGWQGQGGYKPRPTIEERLAALEEQVRLLMKVRAE